MNHDAARNKRLILHLHIPGHQRTTRDHNIVAQRAIMRHMPAGHDVIQVADRSDRFRLSPARNSIVFADLIAVADLQVTALASKALIQRIRAKHRPCRNLIAVSKRSPAPHKTIRLKNAISPNHHILIDNAKLPNARASANHRLSMNARTGSNNSRRINSHGLHHLATKPWTRRGPAALAAACRWHARKITGQPAASWTRDDSRVQPLADSRKLTAES